MTISNSVTPVRKLVICEKWFICFGLFAVIIIVLGIIRRTNMRQGEVLIFFGVGILAVLTTYLISQRHQNRRRRVQRPVGQDFSRQEDPLYVITYTTSEAGIQRVTSRYQPDSFPHVVFNPETHTTTSSSSNWSTEPKPVNDEPPKYDEIAAGPPSYESLNVNTLPS